MKTLHKLRKTISGIKGMSDHAYGILRGTLMVSCAMLLCSLALLLDIGGVTVASWERYRLAIEMYRTPAGLLLFAVIISACVEDMTKK